MIIKITNIAKHSGALQENSLPVDSNFFVKITIFCQNFANLALCRDSLQFFFTNLALWSKNSLLVANLALFLVYYRTVQELFRSPESPQDLMRT